MILSYPPFKNAIQNITVLREAKDDELLGIAEAILGVWTGLEQKNISLKAISDEVKRIGKGLINIKTYPNIQIADSSQEILRRFDLCFYTCGNNLHWHTSNQKLSGKIIWTPEIEQKLENVQPSDLWELIELLS